MVHEKFNEKFEMRKNHLRNVDLLRHAVAAVNDDEDNKYVHTFALEFNFWLVIMHNDNFYLARLCVTRRSGATARSSKPKVGRRTGQTEDEVGQRDGADQSHVSGRVRRGSRGSRRGREREGPS